MHPALVDCDQIGRRIYPYTEDVNTSLIVLTREDEAAQAQWKDNVERARQDRTSLIERFRAVIPTLSVPEIVEGFVYGGAVLRGMLSGWMVEHHNADYTPLMLQSIREGEPQVGKHCLSWLASTRGQELAPLIIELVRKDWHPLQLDAMYIAASLQLAEALPYAEDLARHPNSAVARTAGKLRDILLGMNEG